MGFFGKKDKPAKDYTFAAYPHLAEIKPRERYVFHSDYFQVDDGYGVVLTFFHNDGATDGYPPFWGVNLIPRGLGDDVDIMLFQQVRRMSEGWISDHQGKAESVAEMNNKEQNVAGTMTTRSKANKRGQDLEEIAHEIQNAASYLHVHFRLLVKAPTLDALDNAVAELDRIYVDHFATLRAAPHHGDQRRELAGLFAKNSVKKGKGFYFTSTEFAGAYNLVTHGLEDPDGEYVGAMTGDVNNSAVILNVDGYKHHVVVANENLDRSLGRVYVSDMWGSKFSQACMLGRHRVVHLVFDGADLDRLGPPFSNITSRIDLGHGDLNMFEMFGSVDDEMSIFPVQMQKLILMAEQAYESTDSDRSIIRGSLEKIATKFYIDQGMWSDNAIANRDRLRVVGLPHEQVPKLDMFTAYLDTEFANALSQDTPDQEEIHALGILKVTFNNMLTSNGDLFNTCTSSAIDGAKRSLRCIYDFSDLMQRGVGVAMAQFVNVLGYAVGNLSEGDVIIVHGTELLDGGIKKYVSQQFDRFMSRGGRVVYLYNKIDAMLADKSFSGFDKADFTLLGNMSDTVVMQYQQLLGQEIPPDLAQRITQRSSNVCYIRRGVDNVVFQQELSLGLGRAKRG